MNLLTIAQLAQFSGVKPHTIRIWEQRYQALTPERSKGNTRSYSDFDLKKLLNIVSLVDAGYKISEICNLKDSNFNKLLGQLYSFDDDKNPQQFVSQLISAGMDFNETSFQKILSHCFVHFGTSRTYKDVIYPMLNRVGLMWSADILPPAQEHFMCNLIRQKLISEIEALPSPNETSKKGILFLPEDEYHEIGLLFAHYILKRKGIQVIYLGSSVPVTTLDFTIEKIKPDFLLLFFVHYNLPENVGSYLTELREKFNNGKIYISGNEKLIGQLNLENDIPWLKNIEDLQNTFQ